MQLFAPESGGLISPGIRYVGFADRSQTESREIRYGETGRVALCDGDLVTITCVDGGVSILLAAFDESGSDALQQLNLKQHETPVEDFGTLDRTALDGWLGARGADFSTVCFARLFGAGTPAAERFTFRSRTDCTLWLALPADGAMISTGGGGTFSIEVARAASNSFLPDPVGDVRDEFTVDSGTARAYELRKGDFVQIIDIEGRQCSDFMAMRADALHRGIERHIDSTVTRTFAGGAYPAPGLFDKFFDQDMQPLLNVTQDSVGRHDTFALACTARGYEERGFPGHLNCSDNISAAYEPFGIAMRSAWPAINFFFNSSIQPTDNRLRVDEACSRPGDHVIMRALTDLVCVSTACPDDIDPINGWNPTDIHVRIYKPDTPIQRAVAYRPFNDSEVSMTQESAFNTRTSALTRSFQVARDLWLPSSYEATRAIDEYWACRKAVTIQDTSSLLKFDVLGPDAERLLQKCLTRDVSRLSVNRGVYALAAAEDGSVLDDGTLFRLGPDLFRWCCGSEESARHFREAAQEDGMKVWIKAYGPAMPSLALQGPNSRKLLERLVFIQPHQPALEAIKWFGVTVARLHDRNGPAFMLSRTGFTGELGYEIFCAQDAAVGIWDALMEAGSDIGITPMGLDALETIRIEAGLMVAGAEFSPGTDAFEAGLGFAVDLKKDAFIGRDALLRNRAAPRRALVGLLFEGNEVPNHGDPVIVGRREVGTVTSATRSPMLGRPIAMARVAVEHAQEGSTIEIGQLDRHSKRLQATITSIPFIDPKRERARA
ncbi:aminomethyltransferase family protein [Nitratireductor sp. XY-223]|uniref:DUF1989 domain-containing protein n=1 Tax=Nitratireductor sp. XY-223 TaxID=2561926 RepID=UPI0019821E1A|nr:aminomethyltransferase family protein [Nitratireductor sp. XY-223]